jgi:cysteinyl-tRNA synthetase
MYLTNSITKTKEEFIPITPGKVLIYCCGVTVYDLCHLGHARSYIVWDVLRRHLMWQGYVVKFVQNFTDIDDKIIARAKLEGTSIEAVSERNIQAFEEDMKTLNILPADKMPRVTNSLGAIRNMIQVLTDKGAAYSIDGDVYFSVMKYAEYGKLSGRKLEQQRSQEDTKKHHPFDFALWKGVNSDEPSFDSPWGPGRPGWHIECSAMIRQELGETIDIHLGGSDLIFPHHENEIAQSEIANGKELAHYWLHNGFVTVGEEKMAKSLGNFTTIRNLIEFGISPMAIRLFVLQAHYRKPIDFNMEAMKSAVNGWKILNTALSFGINREVTESLSLSTDLEHIRNRFISALNDDLNTSVAVGELFQLARLIRTNSCDDSWKLLQELSGVLGFVYEVSSGEKEKSEEIRSLIEERNIARANRDYAKADNIRELLRNKGIEVNDLNSYD